MRVSIQDEEHDGELHLFPDITRMLFKATKYFLS